MKKLISLTLAFAMLFVIAVPASATNKEVKVEILERRDSLNGNFVEISKLGDFYYYFEKTDDEIISMSLAPDGTIDKYVRDVDSNVMQHFAGNNNSMSLTMDTSVNLEFVETITLDVRTSKVMNTRAAATSRDMVVAELISKHSDEYFGQYIGVRNEAGYQCKFYETHTHNVVMHNGIYFEIGSAISAIAGGLGTTITYIVGKVIPTDAIDWATNKITEPMEIDTFSAEAMYTQFVKINNVQCGTAGKKHTYTGISSVYGASFITEVVTADDAFDNFQTLALIGIGNL